MYPHPRSQQLGKCGLTTRGLKPMKIKLAALGALALALTACSKPEPVPVYMQPTYDKVGNASCTDGYQLATTEEGATVCAPIS
jgi:hypothetical protein